MGEWDSPLFEFTCSVCQDTRSPRRGLFSYHEEPTGTRLVNVSSPDDLMSHLCTNPLYSGQEFLSTEVPLNMGFLPPLTRYPKDPGGTRHRHQPKWTVLVPRSFLLSPGPSFPLRPVPYRSDKVERNSHDLWNWRRSLPFEPERLTNRSPQTTGEVIQTPVPLRTEHSSWVNTSGSSRTVDLNSSDSPSPREDRRGVVRVDSDPYVSVLRLLHLNFFVPPGSPCRLVPRPFTLRLTFMVNGVTL